MLHGRMILKFVSKLGHETLDWIQLAQYNVLWWDLVSTAMNIQLQFQVNELLNYDSAL